MDVGFFGLGAAVRVSLDDALTHAACEAVMLFEDVLRGRTGGDVIGYTQKSILSLRNRELSNKREAYIRELIANPPAEINNELFECETICFEPLPGIYAARSFSMNALDPKQFVTSISPSLPLF